MIEQVSKEWQASMQIAFCKMHCIKLTIRTLTKLETGFESIGHNKGIYFSYSFSAL